MATYVNDLRLKEIATGAESGTWGTSTNTNLELIGEAVSYATQESFGSDANATTTVADGAADPARAFYFKVTSSGSLTATRVLTIAPNDISRIQIIENATSGSQIITIKQGTGATVNIPTGESRMVYYDGAGGGAAVVDALADINIGGKVTVGVDDTGYDVKFFGATSGKYLLWDESDDALVLPDSTNIKIGTGGDLQLYHDGSNSYIKNATGALKLATETSGIAVTVGHTTSETTVADNLTVTGNVTVGVDDTGGDVKFFGATSGKYWLWDESADGVVQYSALTVGVDDTGYDVKFFGATSGAYMLWDESADDLKLVGAAGLTVAGNIDIDGTANLDVVDIDGATQADGTITVGADDTGYDVKFFGATSGAYMLWDESADDLKLVGAAGLTVAGDVDIDGTTNLDAVDIDGNVQIDGTVTVGVDDTGKDVKFFGATSGKYLLWDESDDSLNVPDSTKIQLGTGADMDLYHDGTDSYIDSSSDLRIRTGGSDRIFMQSTGNVYNNLTSEPVNAFWCVKSHNGKYSMATGGGGVDTTLPMAFCKGDDTVVGSITTSGTTTAFNTSSDYRLKENVVDLENATTRLKNLKPYRFNFIGESPTLDGFQAHEVAGVVPEAVHGDKDGVDASGNVIVQAMDHSKLVPLLVATVQELEARIAALES